MRNKLDFRVNQQIRAPKIRLIGSDGKQVGVMSLSEALSEARKDNLDLVEVAPKANPPVVRIVDLDKFRYEEEKRRKGERKRAKPLELKEVRFSPFIAENDYNIRFEKVKEFLKDNHKVRVVVVFKGRQMGSKQFGYDLLKRVLANLGEEVNLDMEPKFIGRHLAMVISPVKKRGVSKKNAKTKN